MKYQQFDVWVEVGREGRCFSYKDGNRLGIVVGDLVLVRLRGRAMHGLVVGRRDFKTSLINDQDISESKKMHLENVEGLVQKTAVTSDWWEWLEAMSIECYTSPFRMLKTALPPGWLGQSKTINNHYKELWWVSFDKEEATKRVLSSRQKALKSFLQINGGGAWLKDINAQGFSWPLVKGFLALGLAHREKRKYYVDFRDVDENVDISSSDLESPRELTKEQHSAIVSYETLAYGSALLLWGVTGSGKTEVYLHIVANELALRRSCLILTPEIGLIPQLVDRFTKRFGRCVLEYHSNCSAKERVQTWRKILNNSHPFVVIGTRSAVFLPLADLGLIVLDEEHDSSYKQESPMPCYHARDMALSRAKRFGAKVVLGSATPSLVTWKNLLPNGSIEIANLKDRISRQPLPKVFVVDMRQELAQGNRKLISAPLKERLKNLPGSGEQAVVLVPRRGYNNFLSCRSCGEVVHCPNCDVALTVHSSTSQKWLRCHWCDYRARIERHCNECGSTAFKPFGAGTQRVMEKLSQELEGLRLLRFDRDTTGGRYGHRKLLERFGAGDADVLIGTQMLAKGMDLPQVTLAVVLAADGLLHRPDLFAEEQALQLFMQLAGRAGRGERPGEVLVQTYCPNHPVIKHLIDGRYEEFVKKELNLRKEVGLVPFRRACLLRFAGESASTTATAATALAEQIRPSCDRHSWNVVGPAPSMVGRVAGRSRWQLLLHGPEGSPLPLPKGSVLWESLPKEVSLSVDPDPLQF